MAESYVSIVNQALDRIGEHNAITSLTQASKPAIIANRNYEAVRDWCLRKADWNFAKKRVILAPSVSSPVFADNSQSYFIKPSDCIRIISINDDVLAEYDEEDGGILYYGTAMNLLYVKRVTDVTRFDSLFENFYVTRLAEIMSPSLTDSVNKKRSLRKDRLEALSEARSTHSQERGHRTLGRSRFIEARR